MENLAKLLPKRTNMKDIIGMELKGNKLIIKKKKIKYVKKLVRENSNDSSTTACITDLEKTESQLYEERGKKTNEVNDGETQFGNLNQVQLDAKNYHNPENMCT
jgi:predicted nuclease with TOPRIM domain